MADPHALFRAKAPGIMRRLMEDFGLDAESAAAVVGNLGHESGGFKFLQEKKPLIPGSRGGWGWAQWTGPRRKAFEAWCRAESLKPESDEANYSFLSWELRNTEKKAIPAVKRARGLPAKVKAFELKFERAGVKHYPSRERWAAIALAAFDAAGQRGKKDSPVASVGPSGGIPPKEQAMSWKKIDGRGLTIAELRDHIAKLPFTAWRPSGLVLHNTAAPTLAQWDPAKAAQRIRNLEHYYKVQQGWRSGPHAFVDDERVWLFTPFNTSGTHSPSFNGTRIGIEMVGDYARESITTGRGLRVWNNTVALFGLLHARLGLDPETIKLHKEDPRTTHDCPGKAVVKDKFIRAVQEFMGQGGEHDPEVPPDKPAASRRRGTVAVPKDDHLNLRAASSAGAAVLAELPPGAALDIIGEAMNGKTKWLRVTARGSTGWVAARFVKPA